MPESGESFTLTDRRELIKQGMQLDQVISDVRDLKVLVKDQTQETTKTNNILETRIRVLEDFKLELRSEIRASVNTIRTTVWIFGIIFAIGEVVLTIMLRVWWK